MFKKATIALLVLAMALLSGCTRYRYQEIKDVDLIEVSYGATQKLLKQSRKPLPANSLIVVTTFVNVDDLNQTSSFGRIVSDQIASAFNNAGYRIKGMEMPTEVFVKEEDGMLQLSDTSERILKANQAAALVVGTFAPGKQTAYVSIRMLDLDTNTVISSTDFSVPMGPDARVLLEPKKVGAEESRGRPKVEGSTEPGA